MLAVAQSSPGIDPTSLALLSIFGGVTVTVIAGLIGAWIQGRREHSRWVRERRYEVYERAMRWAWDFMRLGSDLAKIVARETEDAPSKAEKQRLREQMVAVKATFNDVVGPLSVVGPRQVETAWLDAGMHTDDIADFRPYHDVVVREMRKALAIKG